MKCGIDVGTTLTKAVIETDTGYKYFSTKNLSQKDFINALQSHGVTKARITGIGKYTLPFEESAYKGIKRESRQRLDAAGNFVPFDELGYQVAGTMELLKISGTNLGNEFNLISVGTGTSYCKIDDVLSGTTYLYNHLPVGSFLGGGFLLGMGANMVGMTPYTNKAELISIINDRALKWSSDFPEKSSDILLKDMLPDTAMYSGLGDIIVAACGKLHTASLIGEVCHSLVNMVAASFIKDLLVYRNSGVVTNNNCVFVGTTIATMPALQNVLKLHAKKVGFEVYIPSHADFAVAMGAYLSMRDE